MFIECKPIGKGRPRFKRVGKYVQAYTPKETKEMEKLIADSYRYSDKKHEGKVKINIIAEFEPPKSISKKKRQELIEGVWNDKKPDIDNIIKLVMDALNGVAYEDDKQVVMVTGYKKYADVGGLEIEVIDA